MSHFYIRQFTLTNRFLFFLILLFIISFILRCYNLTFQSYWLDELFSAHLSHPKNELKEVYIETLKGAPPLYQIILWGWYKLVGYSEVTGRLLSAIFGVLSVMALYFLGKELFNKKVGAFAAIILCFNEFSIYYAQENRAYSLLLLLSIVSTLFFGRFLKDSGKGYFILYIISVISVFYTHYFGFFILLTHIIYLLFCKREWIKWNLKYFLSAFVIISLSIFPLLNNIFSLAKIDEYWVVIPGWNFWWYYFIFYFKSRFLIVLFGLLLILALFKLKSIKTTEKSSVAFLVLWISTTYGFSYIRSLLSTPLLTERNTIIVLPAIILLISFGIYQIKKPLFQGLLIVLIIFSSFYSLIDRSYYYSEKKEDWRNVLLEVNAENSGNLPIYDIVYEGWYYYSYAELLNMDMEIKDHYQFLEDEQKSQLPDQFWIMDAHRDNIQTLDILKSSKFKIQKTIQHTKAKAVLVKRI